VLTITDLFCGAGGSSSGAEQIPGVRVRMAANHWQLAVDTHAGMFPHADHDVANVSQTDPRRYPRTDILWASPECTNHSQARGKRRDDDQPDLFGDRLPPEAAERSRATMFDVLRFAEHHAYRGIVVENVVDVRDWRLWPAWVTGLDNLGYDHTVVYLNSMFAQAAGAPAPQSRDRLYVVAWRRGGRVPDLARWTRPPAWCPGCELTVQPIQAWKRADRQRGRYRQQYVWRCPTTACRGAEVYPGVLPAAVAIDWTLAGERIGSRVRPLAAKTLARIEAGLRRYARPIHIEAAGNTYERPGYARAWPADTDPLRTLHRWDHLLVPYYGTAVARRVSEPTGTVTTVDRHALVGAEVQVDDCTFRMLEPHEIQAAMAFGPSYVVLGTKRDRVRMLGNAVTPPAARDLIAALAEAITGEAA
jgi:DNA (cytosine-5)-methyltransferase 1